MSSVLYRGAVLAFSTTVVLPYALAVLCNFLYGWPIEEKKYRRALNPKKVYAVNWHILKQFLYLKYTGLFLRAKYLYYTAEENRLVKNIVYGGNENQLDIYFPRADQNNGTRPVVVFVYGGAWSSGDKSIYSLVCSEIADRLQTLVVCPNYSIYPKGYVDDMIQDVVDCVAWIHDNIDSYGGQGDQLMLIGHSAGAHLCTMAVLELYKQLPMELHDVFLRRVTPSSVTPRHTPKSVSPFHFDERHYDGDDDENGRGRLGSGDLDSESFVVLSESQNTQSNNQELLELSLGASLQGFNVITTQSPLSITTQKDGDTLPAEIVESNDDQQPLTDSSGSSVQVVPQVESKGVEVTREEASSLAADYRPRSHVACMMQSIKAVIGLAGVFNIEKHYQHEYSRAVEDLSCMARAMHGPHSFDRFSPTIIVQDLPKQASLPYMMIMHGTNDVVVPLTSSTFFVDAVHRSLPEQPIDLKVILDCDHVDICFDIGAPNRKYHEQVMRCLVHSAQKVF